MTKKKRKRRKKTANRPGRSMRKAKGDPEPAAERATTARSQQSAATILNAEKKPVWSSAWLAPVFILLFIAVWFWPVAVGQRPFGDDISSVYFPQMSYYGRTIQDGRLPLWNEQSGFGSPVLAEGQIGVLYPLHLALYGLWDARNAFALSMIIHFALAAWFAYLCARGFEITRPGATLVALVFIGQGFFINHLTQQWSYTAGCWLPLAVLAVWRWTRAAEFRWLLVLAVILAIQLLAGHFQIAFYTLVTVFLMGLATTVFVARDRRWDVFRRSFFLLPASLGALALAAIQLAPTAELAMLGDTRGRGYEFLASFGMPPSHLINYLAPTLYHQHPLWEWVAWIPWHTSRNECLVYIGLIPIGLAFSAIVGGRREEKVRVWSCLLLCSVALSLGPFLPGYRWLVQLPGFGWFSAPARWSIVSGLFLALLAGRGLDRLRPDNFREWCRRFTIVAVILLVLGTGGSIVMIFLTDEIHMDPFSHIHLLSHGYEYDSLDKSLITPAGEIWVMLSEELTLPAINLSLLMLISLFWSRKAGKKQIIALLLIWSAVDLGVTRGLLGRLEFEKNLPMTERSAVLFEVAARAPQRHRVAGTIGNQPMAVGATPLSNASVPDMTKFWNQDDRMIANMYWPESFSTVPLPTRWGDLGIRLGRDTNPFSEDDLEFLRLSDIRLLVCNRMSGTPDPNGPMRKLDISDPWLTDPWLTTRVFGQEVFKHKPLMSQWTLWEPKKGFEMARAWAFPVSDPPEPGTDPRIFRIPPPAQRRMLEGAIAAEQVIDDGEQVQVIGKTNSAAVLVLSDMYYPGWEAVLTQNGASHRVPIEPAFGGWRGVKIPAAGEYHLNFNYRPDSFRLGRQISLVAVFLWAACFLATFLFDRSKVRWMLARCTSWLPVKTPKTAKTVETSETTP